MEDKRISEKESLELIARMIRETQDNTARHAAYPLLIWGYTTILIAIAVCFFWLRTGAWQVNYLWFALPVIGVPLTLFFSRKDKRRGARNYIDRITSQIWIVLGMVGCILSCMSFIVRIDILFIISLLMSIGLTLSGLVSRYKLLSTAGIIGIILSMGMPLIHGYEKLLIFAAIFFVIMVIPGHIMNRQLKQC